MIFNMFKMIYEMKLNGANIIQLPKNLDRRGNLSVVEEITNIPFEIKRTYWIYDVPGGAVRGGHAYRNNEEFIVALSGSFDVILDNGLLRTTYSLNRSYYGLYVPKGVWRQMVNFSTNSLALIVASIPYDPGDYIYDYELFKELSTERLSN
jgi:dTDP-4-dehydrorhamnose 3,5-epimerase-like enzyme